MPSVGLLIFVAIVGAFICAKARSAAGAILFALMALVFFVATPIGDGLPGAVATFMSVVDDAATPALHGQRASTSGSGS